MKTKTQSRWQLRKMIIIYALSALAALLLFPGTDPHCKLRYILFGILSLAFWIRVIVAKCMNDQSNADSLWLGLVVAAPPIIFLMSIAQYIPHITGCSVRKLNWSEIITCTVSVWMAVVATMALNTWKRQSKAKKQTDFLDEITDAVHKYIDDLSGPTEMVKFIKFGIESHLMSPLLQEKDVENPEIVAYIKQSGEKDAEFLNEHLSKCNQSVYRIHTLVAKGQVLGLKNYDICHESCRMLTWQHERIQALSFMIGNVNLNWKNEEVQKSLTATTSLEYDDVRKHLSDYNKKFLTFVKENYEEIFK